MYVGDDGDSAGAFLALDPQTMIMEVDAYCEEEGAGGGEGAPHPKRACPPAART